MTYMPPMHYLQAKPGCGCPACAGLTCLERPRFFAGQLLTESELTGEQAYVIAKNRLHNRYLHGAGVVCGLQVVCGDCEGHVTIRPGYAIDPCGNDIIVCADYDFNVIKAIEDCCSAARARRSECDPYAPLWDTLCKDVEETWCITLRYVEQEARPTTALPMKTESSCPKCGDARCGCGGSCGCGGHCGGSCGCGASKTAKTSAQGSKGAIAQKAKPGVGLQPGQCEPTRIIETFCVGIVPEAKDWPRKDKEEDGPFAGLLKLAPPGTLLRRIVECLLGPLKIAQQYMTKAEAAIIYANTQGQYTAAPSQQYAALCHFREAVLALYSGNDCSVWCEAAELIGKVVCTPPNSDSMPQTYGAAIAPAVQQLSTLVSQYIVDCTCCAVLPECSSDVTDDRLVLACATVKGGKIIRICNIGPRQFAGSFPSMYYWLSIVPVIPLLRKWLEALCCGEKEEPGRQPMPMAEGREHAPEHLEFRAQPLAGETLFSLFTADNFAFPKDLFARVESMTRWMPRAGGLAALAGAHTADLRGLLSGQQADIERALGDTGVRYTVRDVPDAEADAHRGVALDSPFALRGDRVVAYRSAGKIIGFGKAGDDDVAALRLELDTLRREVAELRNR